MLSLFSLALSLWTFAQGMGEIAVEKGAVLFWTKINICGAALLPAMYLGFVFALLSRKGRIVRVSYAAALLFCLLVLTPLFIADVAPAAGFKFYPKGGVVYPFFAAYVALSFVYGLFELALAASRERGPERRKLLYVVMASVIGFSGGATAFFPVFNIGFPVLVHITLPVYVAITAYAIIKHKLLDITIVIRESLVYSALTVLFAGSYALLILAANDLFRGLTHLNELWAMAAIVFVSVLVFQPLKDRIQSGVDRIFFRGAYYYEKTINDLSEENQKLFRSLIQADKLASLGTMAAGMAHEIKNPLAAIKGMTQLLPENINDGKFMSDYTEMVPRQLDRINRILENLLGAGRKPKLERKRTDIARVLNEALEINEIACARQKISIKKNIASLPEIEADPEQLHQVFLNIILNAVQAMPDGGTLSVSSSSHGGRIMVEIRDTGEGIAPDSIGRIFDPFFSTKGSGTGLGLFMSYRIVQEHGGIIEAGSEPGKGATFKIWLFTRPGE